MEIHLGADHRGYELKQQVADYLRGLGHAVTDHGTDSPARVDYPTYAKLVGEAVAGVGAGPAPARDAANKGKATGSDSAGGVMGILICGSGAGVAIPANKVPGVRCVVAWCEHIAEYGRRHNHANVLAFGADLQTFTAVRRCLDAYLAAAEEGGRHAERVAMIGEMERC